MVAQFSGDMRIMRVCLASSDPLRTLHDIKSGKYSIRTFLDMLEILDAQATIQENLIHLNQK